MPGPFNGTCGGDMLLTLTHIAVFWVTGLVDMLEQIKFLAHAVEITNYQDLADVETAENFCATMIADTSCIRLRTSGRQMADRYTL